MASPVRKWLVDAAQRIDAALGPARVERIVLPPPLDRPGKEGEFCAVQLDDGSVGLAFTLLDGTLAALQARGEQGGRTAMELVRGFVEGDGAARALGLAAINALTRRLYDRAGFVPDDSIDSFGSLALKPGDRLGMVGHFTPLIEQARALGIPVTVLELKAELVREEPGLVVTLDPQRLAGCNKIVSTSTLLLNDTLDRMLACCRNARWFAMIGPGAGCLPDALFARGVTLLGGNWIVDGPNFIDALRRGESTSAFSRKSAITPASYPGTAALLQRIGNAA